MSKEKIYIPSSLVDAGKNLPETPGVYLMKGTKGRLLYVGKAGNLKRRVSSYFLRPHDSRIQKLVSEIKKIDYKETDSALEALILEAELIKKHQPPYNIREKDDKSFLYVEITKEKFPRVLLVRGKSVKGKDKSNLYGPFVSASQIREALRIIRRIFPFSIHAVDGKRHERLVPSKVEGSRRACFDYEVGLCPGTCLPVDKGGISVTEYKKNIKHIKLILSGKTKKIINSLKSEMKKASAEKDFEKAGRFKKQLFAIQHIQDSALISDSNELTSHRANELFRIEGYDISNISGTSAVGSMVVFTNGKPDKDEYRRFKIKTISQPDDTGMISEVIDRRFSGKHKDWGYPDLILIDGGRGQVNAVENILEELNIKIPVVGIAKGATRKNNRFIGEIPKDVDKNILIRVRDEAHRYAISYHRKLRGKDFLK